MKRSRDILHKFAVRTTRRGRRRIINRILHMLHLKSVRKNGRGNLPVSTGPRPLSNRPKKKEVKPNPRPWAWRTVTSLLKKLQSFALPLPARFADS